MAGVPQVDQHVAGTGVEAAHRAVGRQVGDVGDAAEVDDHAMRAVIAEQRAVERRHQRCALPAGGDVAAAEIGDDGDAALLGDARRVVELHGDALVGAMAQRLAVHAGGHDVAQGDLRIAAASAIAVA